MREHNKTNRPQLKLLVGPSGSGKTTFATEFVKKNKHWVRVNRDDIRRNILGVLDQTYYQGNNASMEKHINVLQDEQIRYWLHQGMNVLIDNTNLKPSYINHYHEEFGHMAEITYHILNTPLDVCKQNVIQRDGNINTDYINKQYESFVKISEQLNSPQLPAYQKFYSRDKKLKKAIVVDIDGTIADCTGIRSPYDGDSLHKDRPILPVRLMLNRMKGSLLKQLLDPVTIIYLSGREDKWKDGTIKWIKDNNFPFDGHIYMRTTNDLRKDSTVKQELYYNFVYPYFDTQFVVDDRLQVCHNWYKMGLFVMNVNQGLRHF